MFATIVLSLATLGAALPIKGANNNGTVPHTFAVADQYIPYQGDGSTGAGWPSDMNWGSYDELTQIDMPDRVESSHRQHTTTLPVRSGSANSGGTSSGQDELTELEFNRYGWALGTQEAQHL